MLTIRTFNSIYTVSKLYTMQEELDIQDDPNVIAEFSNDAEAWLHSGDFSHAGPVDDPDRLD